ncbi:hypothetical protein PAAG_08253 [Paracoccidioides lutzii Pb01]|uniref:Acyltransferase 3 domain-containing protein n=1 Tax=Paracoccidioides lutzii (strain ATCC MYA-826 / Pb01) TaxID=502779 RepID=C1HBW2_PARBA|nr:hypothetical protein PAAG_08253 [Paracoccidioides lutzii Pb01]EEH38526.1 hypothetical protein PAAG_08253 [Paracoccidioides lutzii Pb01]
MFARLCLPFSALRSILLHTDSSLTAAMPSTRKRDNNWIDGLRGIASFIVVTGHICTSFFPYLLHPSNREGDSPSLLQLPFLRLIVGGRACVALFFIITGFVNSLQSVKNARSGNTTVALTNLARSTFTRSGRLLLPTGIATCMAWLLCQLHAFAMAERIDAAWIRWGARPPDASVWQALYKLFIDLTLFWNAGPGDYDATQWTLVYFLHGSFRVYLALLAMMLLSTRYWRVVTAFLYIWCWVIGDYVVGINIFAGLMLAQLQVDLGPRATSILPKPVPSLIIIIGLFICSYPEHSAEWVYWSRIMKELIQQITPANTDNSRYWVSVGTTVLMVGIFFSRNARKFLALPLFNFLGRASFAVYLIHNSLMRTVLVWLTYGYASATTPRTNDEGKIIQLRHPNGMAFVFILPVFYAILYVAAYAWTLHVDPWCVNAVDWMKNHMFREEEQEKQLPTIAEKPTPMTAVVA